jgi:hypothetical protein
MESDNVFNDTQLFNPIANFSSGNFGIVPSAAAARQTQLAVKIYTSNPTTSRPSASSTWFIYYESFHV